jgi:hypothetical protein
MDVGMSFLDEDRGLEILVWSIFKLGVAVKRLLFLLGATLLEDGSDRDSSGAYSGYKSAP